MKLGPGIEPVVLSIEFLVTCYSLVLWNGLGESRAVVVTANLAHA